MARITVNRQEILKNRVDSGDRPVWEILDNGETKLVRSANLVNARLVSGEGGRSVWIEAEIEDAATQATSADSPAREQSLQPVENAEANLAGLS